VLELAQLATPEELTQGGDDRPAVDQLLRRGGVGVAEKHALAHPSSHTPETDADLVGDQLSDGADAAVTEVVDVVLAVALGSGLKLDEVLERGHEAVVDEPLTVEPEQGVRLMIELELVVHLVPTRVTEVVPARVRQEAVEVLGGLVDLG